MISEKRISRRYNSHIPIVSSDAEGLNFSFISNLSRDGAYIESEKILSMGTKFDFVLTNGLHRVPVTTRVVRLRDAFFHGGHSGVGVRFDRLDKMAKTVRDDLLLYLMNVGPQSMWQAA